MPENFLIACMSSFSKYGIYFDSNFKFFKISNSLLKFDPSSNFTLIKLITLFNKIGFFIFLSLETSEYSNLFIIEVSLYNSFSNFLYYHLYL